MYRFINTTIKLSIVSAIFLLISCESEALPVSSSFLDDNSFMIEIFDSLIPDSSKTFQDISSTTGNSYRLYAGHLHGIDSARAYLKVNTNLIRSSKYCNIDTSGAIANSIKSIESIKIVLRSFTQLQDSDDTTVFFIDIENLKIIGGFSTMYDWDGDSSLIFVDEISDDFNTENFSDLPIEYDQYTLYISLPITDEWCEYDCFLGDYFISIEYYPDSDYEQYIEFLSSQNYYQNSSIFRPSIEFSFNEFEDEITYFDKWSLDTLNGAILYDSDMNELSNIYYVHNDSLSTKSKVLLIKEMSDDFQDSVINNVETYLNDINIDTTQSSVFSGTSYIVNLQFELNDYILDSIATIDFIMDSIKVISSNIDPSGDNYSEETPEGNEGNQEWDSSDEGAEDFEDLGVDRCPDIYEDPNHSYLCLCDYIGDPDICDEVDEENFVYNSSGTEGNESLDNGELVPSVHDTGSDGCLNELEDGLGGCLDIENDGAVEDPNGDDYNIDPSEDNWYDYGSDGCPDEFEDGDGGCLDTENDGETEDPNGDNWGYDVPDGKEGNDQWDEGEGEEGNGWYNEGEPFSDWGTDGIPEEEEENCAYCIDDGETEGNDMYDEGEPFEDTGTDGVYTVYEDGYNVMGTEGNNNRDTGEEFLSMYDTGSDGCLNVYEDGSGGCFVDQNDDSIGDPNGDDYNIDPNSDNWNENTNPEGTQGNEEYDLDEAFSDWGFDNIPDILENLSASDLLSYYAPQTISYDIYSDLFPDVGPENELDSLKDIIFDVESVLSNSSNLVTMKIHIAANAEFRALEFRINHSPYILETTDLVHNDDLIHKISQNELFEDVSIYDNFYNSDYFESEDNNHFILDYLNGVQFSLNFENLADFINDNTNISINYNYTALALYIDHSHDYYDFFDGSTNIWLLMGSEKRLLGVADVIPTTNFSQMGPLSASGEKEVIIPFGMIINEMIKEDLDINDNMTFLLDGVWDNTSRIVFYKDDDIYSPRLEIFYTR